MRFDPAYVLDCHAEYLQQITNLRDTCRRMGCLFQDDNPDEAEPLHQLADELHAIVQKHQTAVANPTS